MKKLLLIALFAVIATASFAAKESNKKSTYTKFIKQLSTNKLVNVKNTSYFKLQMVVYYTDPCTGNIHTIVATCPSCSINDLAIAIQNFININTDNQGCF